jgi:glycosyltransferase involved in cell wall biosynthesis
MTVLSGRPLPPGWTGKLWAMCQGVEAASLGQTPDYLLLTDADISYAPDALAQLVARAEAGAYVLTSLMVKLRCVSLAERCFVPAFIYFFQMLYPFAWVNRPRHPYDRLEDIRRMVARSAYAQLGYSPLMLAGCTLGMALTFLAGPLLAMVGTGLPRLLGGVVWAMMCLSYQPILRFYRRSPLWGLALPAIALTYMAFTLDSAYQHWRGRGGLWKGRVQAQIRDRDQVAEPK